MARIEALPNGGLRIGALARMSDVAADAEVRRRFPVIAPQHDRERSNGVDRYHCCRKSGGRVGGIHP
jgi:hypothetical protein